MIASLLRESEQVCATAKLWHSALPGPGMKPPVPKPGQRARAANVTLKPAAPGQVKRTGTRTINATTNGRSIAQRNNACTFARKDNALKATAMHARNGQANTTGQSAAQSKVKETNKLTAEKSSGTGVLSNTTTDIAVQATEAVPAGIAVEVPSPANLTARTNDTSLPEVTNSMIRLDLPDTDRSTGLSSRNGPAAEKKHGDMDQEPETYWPYGRPGGGAPRREYRSNCTNYTARTGTESQRDCESRTADCSVCQSQTSVVDTSRSQGPALRDPSFSKPQRARKEQDPYRMELRVQFEEQQREKMEARKLQEQLDRAEDERVRREQEEMRQEYEKRETKKVVSQQQPVVSGKTKALDEIKLLKNQGISAEYQLMARTPPEASIPLEKMKASRDLLPPVTNLTPCAAQAPFQQPGWPIAGRDSKGISLPPIKPTKRNVPARLQPSRIPRLITRPSHPSEQLQWATGASPSSLFQPQAHRSNALPKFHKSPADTILPTGTVKRHGVLPPLPGHDRAEKASVAPANAPAQSIDAREREAEMMVNYKLPSTVQYLEVPIITQAQYDAFQERTKEPPPWLRQMQRQASSIAPMIPATQPTQPASPQRPLPHASETTINMLERAKQALDKRAREIEISRERDLQSAERFFRRDRRSLLGKD